MTPTTQLLPAALTLIATALPHPLPAQPTFTQIIVSDSPPLDLEPRADDLAADGDVFIARMALSPRARERLRRALGHRHILAIDDTEIGPAIFSGNRISRIPGDRSFRGEIDAGIALRVLGLGADPDESLAAAHAEPAPRCVLVGAHPTAQPPEGWQRVGDDAARPVIWVHEVEVHGDFPAPGGRSIGVMDDWPFRSAHSAWWSARHDQPGPTIGPYPAHLQGVTTDPAGNVYWSWTDRIVKTDVKGAIVAEVAAPSHQGDLTWHDGRVVVAVNRGKFNDPAEAHDSFAFVFDTADLRLLGEHALPEVRYGAGGVCWAGDRYVVVGGLPDALAEDPTAANEVHEYDASFRHLRTVRLPGGWTRSGIQTAEFAFGRFWFGCYGEPRCVLVASPDLRFVTRCDYPDLALGVARGPFDLLVRGVDEQRDDGHHGTIEYLPFAVVRGR